MISSSAWLMLVASLPGQQPAARMRLWRGLKACGAATLRDGVYVLPASSGPAALREQATEITASGGSAYVIPFATAGDEDPLERALVPLFDREAGYAALLQEFGAFRTSLARCSESEARRRLTALRRDFEALAVIDFFPGAARAQLAHAIEDAETALNAHFAPDEPHAAAGRIGRHPRTAYRGRLWATRVHLWVDRAASAWLIRRFIDSRARFTWLRDVRRCPKKAIGFDFDGAQFTHVGASVTFEVLMASFGLDADPALVRLGAMVHYLDVGGVAVPEAAGFAAIMAGARANTRNDDELLKTVIPTLDYLYAAYAAEQPHGARPRRGKSGDPS
ncbi:MAG: chromate resistance protein [Gammaproteobacteria bacterium]|nr:chromate resistance protein [Gammaproteobacteria bacterium]